MDGFLRLRYTTPSRQAADALYFSGTGPGTEHSMPADQNQGQVFSTSRRSMAGGAAEEGPKKAVELLIRDCLKTWKCMLEQAREPATRSHQTGPREMKDGSGARMLGCRSSLLSGMALASVPLARLN